MRRRYSDFLWLRAALAEKFPTSLIPSLAGNRPRRRCLVIASTLDTVIALHGLSFSSDRSPSISLARSLTLLPCPFHFRTHAQTHACVHVCMYACMHAYMHACSYIHTHIHTYAHTCIRTHKHTHTHTHTHTISHEDVAVIVHRKGAAWSERCIRVSLRRAEKERPGALLPPRHLSSQPLKGFSPASLAIIPPPMPA